MKTLKHIITFLFLLISVGVTQAQTTTNKAPKTEQQLTKTSTTDGTTIIYKGETYKVYTGTKGGKYIVIVNGKGSTVKHYLPKSTK